MTTVFVERHPAKLRSYFFLSAAVLMAALVFAGFSRTFYLRLLVPEGGRLPLSPYLYVHGAVMTAWYALFATQAFLVASGRVSLHRRIGVAGAVLAAAVVATGAYASLRMPGHFAALGAPPEVVYGLGGGIMIGNLLRLVLFAGLFIAAVWLRRRSQWHGRLMFWSFLLTLDPAFGGGGTRPLGPLIGALAGPALTHFLPLIVGFVALAAHDWLAARRVHAATWVGGVAYAVYTSPLPFMIVGTPAARAFIESLM
jgi:hypothetical protein